MIQVEGGQPPTVTLPYVTQCLHGRPRELKITTAESITYTQRDRRDETHIVLFDHDTSTAWRDSLARLYLLDG